jgi:hypothetical protein
MFFVPFLTLVNLGSPVRYWLLFLKLDVVTKYIFNAISFSSGSFAQNTTDSFPAFTTPFT